MTNDPTHLGALETGWDEGYLAGLAAAATDSEAENPHTKLFDDRRAYVEQQIVDTYGPLTTEDGDSLFDYAEVVDAILDAHADWMTAHQTGDSAAEVLLRYVTTALVHTVEYVGPDTLPALPGWSWFDALSKVMPDHPLLTRHRPDVRRTQGWASYPVTPHGSASNEDTKPETSQATCGHAGIALTTSEGEICTVVCALPPGHNGPHEDGLTGVKYVDER